MIYKITGYKSLKALGIIIAASITAVTVQHFILMYLDALGRWALLLSSLMWLLYAYVYHASRMNDRVWSRQRHRRAQHR